MAKHLHVDKISTFFLAKRLCLGKTFTFQQNLYIFLAKPLAFGKNYNFVLAKPYFLTKPPSFHR